MGKKLAIPNGMSKSKLKVRNNEQCLFLPENIGYYGLDDSEVIINFMNKGTYKEFKQIKNHLLIDTTEGLVDLVFTSEVPTLRFSSYCKDQLVLKLIH